ncbi:MAG: YdcF family protein [Polyangiaceae bacterium]|nr:YdcF family protein [Polyangiaceae bacterium]
MTIRILTACLLVIATACSGPSSVGEEGEDAAACEVPAMQELYPGPLPPNPDEDRPKAGACIAQKHDVIVVLGCPSNADGSASDCQTERADIASNLHTAGYGDHFIVTGGAVHNEFSEADTLRDLLLERDISSEAIVVEPLAEHTDENIYYSSIVMQEHGWRSGLVVSDSAGQLLYNALCDSNCCVDLGRLTVVDLDGVAVGHYVLYPDARPVTDEECNHVEDARMGVCLLLGSRRACKDHFEL